MRIIRFSATPDGGSHFSELDLTFPEPFTDQFGGVYHLSKVLNPTSAIFVDLPSELDQGWHLAPNRQFVILLSGCLEVETTDGETRRWNRGDIFMADDTSGKGHRTRVVEGPVRVIFMRMPEDFDLAGWTH
ncbi:MAG TPA: hypothetical protein VFE65_08450 [Pseudonocardia sp.]|jgi:hypothetical protein|nr:hypothetical protein [Pseudonocardia sp.]